MAIKLIFAAFWVVIAIGAAFGWFENTDMRFMLTIAALFTALAMLADALPA